MHDGVHDDIRDVCYTFKNGVQSIIGEKLFGIYLYGAVTFPETEATGDIDFHVVLKEYPTEDEKAALLRLHHELENTYSSPEEELDGYYILLKDLTSVKPPLHLLYDDIRDSSWALHRQHIRSGRFITLYGPDPMGLYQTTEWSELEEALLEEMDYVRKNLLKYPDYCILNICRIVYSFTTKDVVISKTASAEWGSRMFPEWNEDLKLARKSYAGKATEIDKNRLRNSVPGIYDQAYTIIEKLVAEKVSISAFRR